MSIQLFGIYFGVAINHCPLYYHIKLRVTFPIDLPFEPEKL